MQSAAAKCFLFTAAIFLLQMFPLTGTVLMIVAAPFWSVITVNLGLILVIADVVAGTLPRWAIALPVIYFGGYAVTTGASHFEARSLANGVLAANAGKSLAFDPNRESLFFESLGPALGTGSDFSLDTLIESYAINTAYRRWETRKVCPIYAAVELRSWGCAQGSGVIATDANGCVTTTRSIWASGGSRLLKGICRAYTPITSLTPTVTLQRTAVQSKKAVLIEAGIETYELRRSDGASIQIKAGYVHPLAWLPIPVMGCMPRDWDSSARGTFPIGNDWLCAVYFARDYVRPLGVTRDGKPRGATDAVAGALKLPASPVTARFPERSS